MKFVEAIIILTMIVLAFSFGRAYEDHDSQKTIATLADKNQSCEEKLDMWRKYAAENGIYKRYKKTVFRY